jgi:hypothetical protein
MTRQHHLSSVLAHTIYQDQYQNRVRTVAFGVLEPPLVVEEVARVVPERWRRPAAAALPPLIVKTPAGASASA